MQRRIITMERGRVINDGRQVPPRPAPQLSAKTGEGGISASPHEGEP
jgi:hypothetical protein